MKKKQVFKAIVKKLKYSDLTENLFATIADNTRFGKFDSVLKSFIKIMSAHKGEITCEIVTAQLLNAESLKEVTAAIGGFVKPGQKLNITTKVDPSIIGGMIVSIGDKYVDMSIASRIKHYARSIEEAL